MCVCVCVCVKMMFVALVQTVAMKFILKHGKSEKDIHNLRQEIEVLLSIITNYCFSIF